MMFELCESSFILQKNLHIRTHNIYIIQIIEGIYLKRTIEYSVGLVPTIRIVKFTIRFSTIKK